MKLHKHQKLQDAFDLFVRQQNALLPDEETLSTITFSDNFKLRMQKLLRRQRQGFFVLFGTAGRRVASIAVAVLVAASVATVSVKALRDPVIEFFTEVFEIFTVISFGDGASDTTDPNEIQHNMPTYIPEGYEVDEEYAFPDSYEIIYKNASDEEITYCQFLKDGFEIRIDTEGITTSNITIGPYNGLTYTNKGVTHIIFTDELYAYKLDGTDFNVLLKMAESLTKK